MDNLIIDLNKCQTTFLKVRIGTILKYTYPQHSSVGYEGNFKIENQTFLALEENQITYHDPKRMAENNISGADGATGQFLFKAIKTGQTKLTLQHLFRFEVEKELIFDITITS